MTRRVAVGLALLAGLLFAGAVVLVAYTAAAFGDVCENRRLSTVPAPSGRLEAVVFRRDCGATTEAGTQVSVLAAGQALPDHGGNAFVADADHGRAPAGAGGGPVVEVAWEGDAALVVWHDARARVFTAEPVVEGVRIRYDAQGR
jgi:hypothetical protein